MQLGDKVKAVRLQNGMTLMELSRDAEVSKSMLSNIERNRSAPTITTLQKIAAALGVDLASLITDLDTGRPRPFTRPEGGPCGRPGPLARSRRQHERRRALARLGRPW